MISAGLKLTRSTDRELRPWRVPENIRERFRGLHASLCRTTQPAAAIGVTAIDAGEGVTWVVSKLAWAFNEARQSVAVVDVSDQRRSSQADVFGLDSAPTQDGDLRRWSVTGDLLVAAPQNPGDLDVGKAELSHWIRAGRSVLVDCKPVSSSSQVLQLASVLTGVVIVVQAERQRHQVLASAITSIERTGVPVLGTVLNRRRNYIPGFLYRIL